MSERNSKLNSKLASTTALVAVALLSVSAPAFAATVTVNTAETATKALIAADELTVTSSGSVAAEPAVDIDAVAATSITNAGTISATSDAAIQIINGGSLTGALTNTGTITSVLDTSSDTTLYGLYMNNGSIGGALTNSGTISAVASGTSSDDITHAAYGIYAVNGSLFDSVVNTSSGTISGKVTITATDSEGDATAVGIYLSNTDITNALTNAGTISGTASVTGSSDSSATVSAYGLWLDSVAIGGAVTNSGTITGNASSTLTNETSYYAYAYASGIYAESGTTLASLTNTSSGTISGIGNASNYGYSATATGAGIYLDSSDITGALTNAGTISGNATAYTEKDSEAEATAYGLYAGSSSTIGSLDNSGTISGIALAKSAETYSAEATAYGINLRGSDISGLLKNSGTISGKATSISGTDTATSSGGSADAYAYGLYASGSSTIDAVLNTSSGTISAIASATGETDEVTASAYAVYLSNSDITGALTNAGTISATATGANLTDSSVEVYAAGIYALSGSSMDSLDNSGTISASATASSTDYSADAEAYGLRFNNSDITGLLNNSGTISGNATVDHSGTQAEAIAYGIYAENNSTIDAVLNTSGGTISATADATGDSSQVDATAYAIYLDNTDITNALTNAGTISASATSIGTSNTSSSAQADAIGFYAANGSTLASIDNSGTISAISSARNDEYSATAEANGLEINASSVAGAVANSGTISASATAATGTGSSAEATARGAYFAIASINSFLNSNSGVISATATSTSTDVTGAASATGVNFASSTVTTNITNDGTISATANGTSTTSSANASARGIIVGNTAVTGFLSNTGDIMASATVTSTTNTGTAHADGVFISGTTDIAGGMTNTGTISASATGTTNAGVRNASGVNVNPGADISGGLTNSGVITASASGGVTSNVYGVTINNAAISGGITNTGTISGGAGGIAINLVGLTAATPININGGRIIGDVIDDTPANGRSDVTIGGDFTTEGDFDVSDLVVTASNTLTITAGDNFQIRDMSASAGTISFGVGDSSVGQLIVTNGDVDLTGATLSVTVTGSDLTDGDELLIADGSTTVTGGSGGTLTDITDNSFLWSFQYADGTAAAAPTNDTDLFLFVSQDSTIGEAASTPANESLGEVLDDLTASTDTEIQTLIASINSASSQEEINEILEAVQPSVDGGAISGALNVTNTSIDITGVRLASLRNGGGAASSGMAAGFITKGLRAWGQFFGSDIEQDKRQGIDGFQSDTLGLAVGADTENLIDGAVVGLSFSYANTDVKSDNTNQAKTDVDSYQITLYGDYDLDDRTFVNAMLGYTHHSNETSRIPAAGLVAKADYDADQFTVRSEFGRDYAFKGMKLTPSVMGHWTHYNPDSYTETGAGGLNSSVDADSVDIVELGLNVDAVWTHSLDSGATLAPELRAGYRYDLVGDAVTMTSQLAGGGQAFTSEGFDPAQSVFTIGAGVTYYETNNWEFTASYDYEMKSDFAAHAGFVRGVYKF